MSKKFQNSRPKLQPVWESLSTKGLHDETVDETADETDQGDTYESTADVEKQNKKQTRNIQCIHISIMWNERLWMVKERLWNKPMPLKMFSQDWNCLQSLIKISVMLFVLISHVIISNRLKSGDVSSVKIEIFRANRLFPSIVDDVWKSQNPKHINYELFVYG